MTDAHETAVFQPTKVSKQDKFMMPSLLANGRKLTPFVTLKGENLEKETLVLTDDKNSWSDS